MAASAPRVISVEQAKRHLLSHLGLRKARPEKGVAGLEGLIEQLGCVQLDPLDRIGENADLVALARVDGVKRGQLTEHLLGAGQAFEHFYKERCLLPRAFFAQYRAHLRTSDWWQFWGQLEIPTDSVIEDVLAEVTARGRVAAGDLLDRGRGKRLSAGQSNAIPSLSRLAVEILWSRCQVVVCGRSSKGKLYELAERVFPEFYNTAPDADFGRWSVVQRTRSAGLLSVNAGPNWSLLSKQRTALVALAVQEGLVELVQVEGHKRRYLAPLRFLEQESDEDDGRTRIIGPLDPLMWDRNLVAHLFGFEYVWEVYKPPAQRKWGYYVCPILQGGELVGRFEGRRGDGRIVVESLWMQDGARLDEAAWAEALERHWCAQG
ncbi:MAG: hypothetical protein COW42_12700 [Deltaproteobacteria bacterium CG17_big_fil_post_rev_8_21_14_2_50_63_7]|nr:MAG: hypothetical protein COW42_12700 [Deltaproteobacteria bacterium CG17_big_fil_post_rev_8_21_14_2_50_63_7]